jgi:hypothetical protein
MKRAAFFLATAFVLATGSAFVSNANSKLSISVYYSDGTGACQGPVSIDLDCSTNVTPTPCTYQGFNTFLQKNGSSCDFPLYKIN